MRVTIRAVWKRWLASFPELALLDLDVGRGQSESRSLHNVTWLTQLLMPTDERVLHICLERLAEGDLINAAAYSIRDADRGALIPDIHLLAGAFHLADGRLDEAVRHLQHCYQCEPEPGLATRRMYPSLRLLVRVTPCVLLPLYPNAYGVEFLYAIALWRQGESSEALEVLRDMAVRWGMFAEMRLIGGIIHLERGNTDRALTALTITGGNARDALEMSRLLHLAYTHHQREEYRKTACILSTAISMMLDINPHLQARMRLLLAEAYERNGLLLNALRESSRVPHDVVPGDVARVMLEREERWVTELSLLTSRELERLANVNMHSIHLPEHEPKKAAFSPLDTTRNPTKELKPRQMSWLKRQKEEREISSYRAAIARGEDVSPPGGVALSADAVETKLRIKNAEQWWPSRRQTLVAAHPSERLAQDDPAQVGHLRFDYCGKRESPRIRLQGEKRARIISTIAMASLLIFLGLWILQTCTQ